jgi:hypothetical protein
MIYDSGGIALAYAKFSPPGVPYGENFLCPGNVERKRWLTPTIQIFPHPLRVIRISLIRVAALRRTANMFTHNPTRQDTPG